MIELARHIEILLLDNDCVIVPGFGGFVSHRHPSRYVEEENLFLPPTRTVGFNPQMTLNDGLLVQSFMMAYDSSYPEAVRLVEHKVHTLENTLHEEGRMDLHGVGTLYEDIEGKYSFRPVESGILSPTLYGLSSYEFLTLEKLNKLEEAERKAAQPVKELKLEPKFIEETNEKMKEMDGSPHQRYINWAAAAIAIVLISLLGLQIYQSDDATQTGNTTLSGAVTKDTRSIAERIFEAFSNGKAVEVKAEEPAKKEKTVEQPAKKETPVKGETLAKEEALVKVESPVKSLPHYTLVLASQVGKKNATRFIENLKNKHQLEAELQEDKNLRIVYGQFETEGQAYAKRNELMQEVKEFKTAWVMKVE